MATTTQIKMSDAKDATNNIKRLIKNQRDSIKSYKNSIAQMEGNWKGEGYKGFVETFKKMEKDINPAYDRLENYNGKIIALLDEIERIDNTAAAKLRSVK